jgi:Leucine-rich repeat (LRR) protein
MTTTTTVGTVAMSRVFRHLTTLSFRDERGGGRTMAEVLARLPTPPRLKSLDLSGNRLTAEHLRPLLASKALAAVEELNLSDNNLRSATVGTIAAADLPRLRVLHLLRTQPEEAGVRALTGSELFAGLRSLSLGENNLPAAVAEGLAGPGAANLRVLDVRGNRLGDAGARALAASPHLRNLLHLDLATNRIGDDGAEALADSPHLGGLICLDLHGNDLSPEVAALLRRRFGDRVFL